MEPQPTSAVPTAGEATTPPPPPPPHSLITTLLPIEVLDRVLTHSIWHPRSLKCDPFCELLFAAPGAAPRKRFFACYAEYVRFCRLRLVCRLFREVVSRMDWRFEVLPCSDPTRARYNTLYIFMRTPKSRAGGGALCTLFELCHSPSIATRTLSYKLEGRINTRRIRETIFARLDAHYAGIEGYSAREWLKRGGHFREAIEAPKFGPYATVEANFLFAYRCARALREERESAQRAADSASSKKRKNND